MNHDSVVRRIVENWGGIAREIKTSSKEESDWLCELDGFKLLVEEKAKLESAKNKTIREGALRSNEVHSVVTPLSPNKRLSAIIRKAGSQLISSAQDVEHDARILWFTGMDFDGEMRAAQAINTLYGRTKVFELDGSGLRDCYFFYHSEFYRLRNTLDGAIVGHLIDDTLESSFCLNPYSPRWEILKNSAFAERMSEGLIDPYEKESNGHALIADTSINRNSREDVLMYLRKKYNMPKLISMDMNMAIVVAATSSY